MLSRANPDSESLWRPIKGVHSRFCKVLDMELELEGS
jgi:hypothetical protein